MVKGENRMEKIRIPFNKLVAECIRLGVCPMKGAKRKDLNWLIAGMRNARFKQVHVVRKKHNQDIFRKTLKGRWMKHEKNEE